MTSVFVTGTDTDVGKTRVSVALIELLQNQGLTVAAMKPVASGCEMTEYGLRNDDALQLNQQANVDLDYELTNPYAFEPAIAPHIAAKQAGAEINLDIIKNNFQQIKQQADAVVVEGAGGWLVPITSTQTMEDLAVALALPVILVVDIRLGCINHALLTVQAIKQSGLVLNAWVANQKQEQQNSAEIIATLRHSISATCLGIIPPVDKHENIVKFLTIK